MKLFARIFQSLLASLLLLPAVSSAITPAPPELSAKGYILMDYTSGQVLVEHNADEPLPPASLTKMMTSYVVSHELKNGKISGDDMVTVSENAWAKNFPGSSVMFIEVGNQVSVHDLLKGVIIQSGNDASVALAEFVAGSEDSFADLMNHHANQLGLLNTHFKNSTGLPEEGHVTTARDMALLARALIRDFPDDYELYAVKEFTYNNIRQYNRNRLLWDRSLNVDGVKTGHTEAAGYCLVSSAQQDGMRLIAVVMGTDSENARKSESKKLLSYGFRFFETVQPITAGTAIGTPRIWYGEKETLQVGSLKDISVTIPRGQKQQLKANYALDTTLEAPIAKGQKIGRLFFQLNGEDIAEYPLVALEAVPEGGWWSRFTDWISRAISDLFD